VVSWKNRPATYEITNPSGVKIQVLGPRGASEGEIVAYLKPEYGEKKPSAECAATSHPKWCDDPIVASPMPGADSPPNIWHLIALGVGVPAALLLAWLAALWIIAGFRRRQPN
jgi:hypothetical protein